MKLFVVLIVSFTVTFAVPHPRAGCMVPPEWESDVDSFDHDTGFNTRGRLAHDERNERIHFFEEFPENSTAHTGGTHSDLYLFKERVHYRVDMKTKNCSKFALDRTFPSHAVPPNSTYMGEFTIGSLVAPGSGVVIQSWGRKTPNGESLFSITSIGCVPVEFQYFGGHGGSHIHYHRLYYNVQTGIADPSIFEIPKECV